MSDLTLEQLRILRHMLGINTPTDAKPKPYRNYYCANKGDQNMKDLVALGAVRLYRDDGPEKFDFFECTPAGTKAAMDSHREIRLAKAKRVYCRFLDVSDVLPDLTFKQFITDPRFAQTRRDA